MRRLFTLLALSGCTNAAFTPETLVRGLRVLSISVEPPEVAPGEAARLSVLKSDAAAGTVTTVLWVGCAPDPQDLGESPCNDASILLRPTQITDYPEGLNLLGFGLNASYQSLPTVFDVLPPESTIRRSGSVGQVLGLVIGEEVDPLATGPQLREYFARIERKETPVVVSLTRVLVSEKPPEARNRNPGILGLSVNGRPHPKNARVAALPGERLELSVSVPDDVRQTYVEAQPGGDVTKTETVVGAWYSNTGRFSRERFDATQADATTFIAPGSTEFPDDTVPERRSGTLWLVVRDNRGGQTFDRFPLFVCDPSLPVPNVTSITPPSSPDLPVVVRGENLSAVLDVIVGDTAIDRGTFSAAQGAFLGEAPQLSAGSYSVRVRSRSCVETETGLRYVVP